jgi:hypothetical protein
VGVEQDVVIEAEDGGVQRLVRQAERVRRRLGNDGCVADSQAAPSRQAIADPLLSAT